MIRKSYSFVARGICASAKFDVDTLCVFFGCRRPTQLEFFDELTVALRALDTLPDYVLILADTAIISVLHEYWVGSTTNRSVLVGRGTRRGVPFVKEYQFAAWDPKAGVQIAHNEGGDGVHALQLDPEALLEQGLKALVDANPVVQVAPAGHVFRHPSKTVNKLFIQARELATNESELAFVARCLAWQLPALLDQSLVQVYIDSMGIYSLVREALNFAGSSAAIHSFHSYEDLSKLSPPSERYAVVISASTSGGMAKRLADEQRFDSECLITLVDVTRQQRPGRVLIALDTINPIATKQLANVAEVQIELFGEHFSSKAKPPRPVTLGQVHSPRLLAPFLKQFGIKGVKELNATPHGSSAPRIVSLDRELVASNAEFKKWLRQEVAWRVPVSVNHVIHAGDAGSKVLAEEVANTLQEMQRANGPTPIVARAELSSGALRDATGVLVVQALAGDGGLMREISRDLREFLGPDTPRHFLIAVGLPQTAEIWRRLEQFLVKNASARDYGFSSWLTLAIGSDGASSAWQTYVDLASEGQVPSAAGHTVGTTALERSIQEMAEAIDMSFNGFLPTSSGEPLALTDGFIYFRNQFDGKLDQVPTSTTFTVIASALQYARDLADPANQLKPSGYESVVLDPENFQRFNDNLLQACLLRAAHSSELDYSSSPHLSRLMKEFLLKVFDRRKHPYGGAALEFAAALASGRLRLADADLRSLTDKAIGMLMEEPGPLLGFICMLERRFGSR